MKKTSFVLYAESIQPIMKLPMEQRGELLTYVYEYVTEGKRPKNIGMVEMAFTYIADSIDRENERFEEVCKARSEAGKKGGIRSGVTRRNKANLQKEATNQSNASTYEAKQSNASKYEANEANEAENENEYESETESESETETEIETEAENKTSHSFCKGGINLPSVKDPKESNMNIGIDTSSALTHTAGTSHTDESTDEAYDWVKEIENSDEPIEVLDDVKPAAWTPVTKAYIPSPEDIENEKQRAEYEKEFEEIWAEYPDDKKIGKATALGYYIRARENGVQMSKILRGVMEYKTFISDRKLDNKYIKMGCTWFRDECWNRNYFEQLMEESRRDLRKFLDRVEGRKNA